MARVVDYSAGKPGAAAIKAAGYVGAVRYIGFDDPANPNTKKCTTAAELADFDAHGLGMALVFEQTAGQWRGGAEQGRADARRAREHANRIGFPADRPIFMAIDQDVTTEADFRLVDAYLNGAAEVLGHEWTGPYGEHDVCVRARRRGFGWSWQCRAWSGSINPETGYPYAFDKEAQLYQHFGNPDGGGRNPVISGIECDVNDVLSPDWGQHNASEEEEMGFSYQQVELPATNTTDFTEKDIVFPDMGGAIGVTDRWVKLHGPGQPFIDSTQVARRFATVQLAHFLNDAGNIVGTYPLGDGKLTHHETGPSVQVPQEASKLVLQYNSVVGLNVMVQVKTA